VEPFKNLINAEVVRAAGAALARGPGGFDRRRFERLALRGLDALEMKARAMHIADALEATLPDDFNAACNAIEASLGAPVAIDRVAGAGADLGEGLAGWIVWPLGEFVARRGLQSPERALRALHALTQRLTAEFAIRPFIVAHPELSLRTLLAWTRDESAHVRRLASEGSRPRLPWGLRLQALVADPTPTEPILAALVDDDSAYVRRSVANHLNDIAKDHPEHVVAWVRQHLAGASDERRALLRHASRTLIKQGHIGMLALWGAGTPFEGACRAAVSPKRVRLGERVALTVVLRSQAARAQSLLIDYAVHHVKADGQARPKVFKGWRVDLAPGETRELVKRHAFREITTRRYHAGVHRFEVLVNGRALAEAEVRLNLR
jgi:3-methyladenine DNA glycosylase AlkC